MNAQGIPSCEQVQLSAMAHLDGEPADLTSAEIDAHLAGCAECRDAVAALRSVVVRLDRLEYESLDVDVWPDVHGAIVSRSSVTAERRHVLVLAAVLALWRLAQLSIDLPAPVVNSIVPLALTALVLWRAVGDPFAIQGTTRQFQEEGVR